MNNLGLKDFFINSRKEKIGLRLFFREFRLELRFAWNRAWRGYDDADMFDCFEMFRKRMIRILEDFTKNGHTLLMIPDESEHYNELIRKFSKVYFDEENTKLIYRTMIFHLQMMDSDYAEKKLYGNNVYDDDYQIGCRSVEDYKKINLVMQQNKDSFMKLFSIFYYQLWD